jgi:two-component system invasion response regulator UvrY
MPIRVFLVDDHESMRSALSAVVAETAGFVVVGSAGSGEDSLDRLRRRSADLVLMDVSLPGMTGIEAARRITAASDPPVVVLLSTYDESELDHRGSGAVAYVNKSAFSPKRLQQLWTRARPAGGPSAPNGSPPGST